MNIAKPVNIWTMHVDNYVRENFLKEVTSPMIYDPSSQVFHPQGLYSEEIFGQIGTSERISTLAYINLHCTVLAPLIYLNIINVASWYKDLMESRIWAIWNKKDQAFEPVAKEAPGARTGFSFFMEHVNECAYEKNSSKTRTQKIDTIYRAFDDGSAWLNKCLVCPAGWRDVKVDISGKMEVDEVNKLYNSIMIAGKEIRDVITTPEIAVFFDTAKVHLQLKVVEIFQYWKNFFEGKTGYGQARYSKRHLALGTRNVITSATLMATSPADPSYMKHNDTNVPLFEALKMYEPKVIYQLNALFYAPIFTLGTVTVQVIDPKTKESVNREVKGSTVTLALGSDYKHGLINSFEDESIRFNPVSILDKDDQPYWLYLVYDLGDTIYIGRSIQELQEQVGRAKSRVPEESKDSEPIDFLRTCYHIDKIKHLKNVDNLELPLSDYVIGASAACVLHGMPVENADIDICVSPKQFEISKMKMMSGPQDGVHDANLTDATGTVDLATTNEWFDFTEQYENSVVVDGYRFVSLEGLFLFYQRLYPISGKEKHLVRLNWIKQELAIREKHDQEDPILKKVDEIVRDTGIPLFLYNYPRVKIWYDETAEMPPIFNKLMNVARESGVDIYSRCDIRKISMHDHPVEEKRAVLNRISDSLNTDTYFLVTLGASITRNNNDRAIKNLRKSLEEYELSIGSNPQEDWKKTTLDTSKIRPLTIAEMLYIAVDSIPDKLCTVTRYPALCSGSIYPSYAKIMSTDPSRQVVLRGATELIEDKTFYHYPIIGNEQFLEGLIIHPSKTTGMNADFDGDKCSCNAILTDEAIAESKKLLSSKLSIITPSRKFSDTLDTKATAFAIAALTRANEEDVEVDLGSLTVHEA